MKKLVAPIAAAPARATPSLRRSRRVEAAVAHTILISACVMVSCPIIYMVLASFKTIPDFFSRPYGLPSTWEFANYSRAWDEARVARTMLNSALVTGLSVLFSTLLAVPASYGLAQRGRRLNSTLYLLIVSGLIVPVQLIVLPLFILMRQLGLFGTLFSIIAPYTALGLPLAVLTLVRFFAALPSELGDAARVDGANEWLVFLLIMLPLVRPALATVIILNGVWMWNDFFIPLVIATRPEIHTLPVGIIAFFGVYSTEWGLVFASVTISVLPLIIAYVLLTRQFIAGLSAGALKG